MGFFAPWCGHCKKMAPDWEKLAEAWDGHAVGLVAEVDCTAAGKPLCDANGVKGFPTLKFGDPAGLDDYQGGRSFKDLSKFATDNLKPVVQFRTLTFVTTRKRDRMKLSTSELDAKIKAEEAKLEKAEEDFKEAVSKLQAEYQKISEVKGSGLGLLKSVKASKAKDGSKDEL